MQLTSVRQALCCGIDEEVRRLNGVKRSTRNAER